MKKCLMCAALMVASLTPAVAGGLLTNTNQNAAFLRQMSQDAVIDITGLYLNPAGTAFLGDGWHLSLNTQTAIQTREIATTFPLFAFNTANPNPTHNFKGEALAPVIPSFQFSWNRDKWSVNAAFAIGGGGGKCEFSQGLGSFEALYSGTLFANKATIIGLANKGISEAAAKAGIPGLNPDYGYKGYSMNAYMNGRQYYFGLSVGATYKILDNLAVFGGVRVVYANCNYNGYVKDVAAQLYSPVLSQPPYSATPLAQYANYPVSLSNYDLSLDCDQTAWGATPILGIDWRINKHWNIAAKYEFKTRIRLKNSSTMNDFAKAQAADPTSALAQFKDGESVAQDLPGILGVGVQYSPISVVRLNVGGHLYFDK
ncbi:MAG: hypothetical protein HUK03_09790, partial [Bacteroidaceae bacterium]|nr:hypothetical protein [Bacteroidaceae bacterium]